jgi:hypothetical protein
MQLHMHSPPPSSNCDALRLTLSEAVYSEASCTRCLPRAVRHARTHDPARGPALCMQAGLHVADARLQRLARRLDLAVLRDGLQPPRLHADQAGSRCGLRQLALSIYGLHGLARVSGRFHQSAAPAHAVIIASQTLQLIRLPALQVLALPGSCGTMRGTASALCDWAALQYTRAAA